MNKNQGKTGQSSSQRLIYRFDKNAIEEVRAVLQTWKSQQYLDLRVWMKGQPSEPGSEQPTKWGITLNIELLPELKRVIEKAMLAEELGENAEKAEEIA